MSRRQTTSVPAHVGIIMDGNGRWAREHGVPRSQGHREGLEAAKRIVREASLLGTRVLTLYVFSTEDWRRPRREVALVLGLLGRALRQELGSWREREIRIVHSGERSRLPAALRRDIDAAVRATAGNTGMVLNLAVDYGGRDEIVRSVNRWLGAGRERSGELRSEDLRRFLDQPSLPEADLIIRTGQEKRLSGFLMWESSYAELVFSARLWPDFSAADLRRAFREYGGRERRFGRAK